MITTPMRNDDSTDTDTNSTDSTDSTDHPSDPHREIAAEPPVAPIAPANIDEREIDVRVTSAHEPLDAGCVWRRVITAKHADSRREIRRVFIYDRDGKAFDEHTVGLFEGEIVFEERHHIAKWLPGGRVFVTCLGEDRPIDAYSELVGLDDLGCKLGARFTERAIEYGGEDWWQVARGGGD